MFRRSAMFALISSLLLLMGACAPSVQAYDPRVDSNLTCEELEYEIARTQTLKQEAQSNRGMSGQNVAWALLFWPGIFVNESANADAIRAADDRLFHLYRYYDANNCGDARSTR